MPEAPLLKGVLRQDTEMKLLSEEPNRERTVYENKMKGKIYNQQKGLHDEASHNNWCLGHHDERGGVVLSILSLIPALKLQNSPALLWEAGFQSHSTIRNIIMWKLLSHLVQIPHNKNQAEQNREN